MRALSHRRADALPVPGIRWGDYPERVEPSDGSGLSRRPRPAPGRAVLARRLARVRAQCADWTGLDDRTFQANRADLQLALGRHGLSGDAADRCCAFAVEAAARALGQRAYDGQIVAALHMLDDRLVELATGEGKSLAVALAAAMGGLAGVPVHVMTANDYLVRRDAAAFAPMYALLGLDVATVCAGQPAPSRRQAYENAIVYVTAQELVFDYLRDRLAHGGAPSLLVQRVGELAPGGSREAPAPRLLRGLCMAIVDEADSILIDEARTPLVLSREIDDAAARAYLWQAWALSGRLEIGRDFRVLAEERRCALTWAGHERIAELAGGLQPVWKNARHRDDTIGAALAARHVLVRDVDYVVVPGTGERARPEVSIVDATTGRIAEGRRWAGGLHALVALKEGCRFDAELDTLARITFQRFFRRYHRLGGMSGTLREARAELRRVYGLPVVAVAARLPCLRECWPTRAFASRQARWDAVAERCVALAAQGRPVLVGTDSVADSAALADRLRRAGIEPAVLDAGRGRDLRLEAALVLQAGRAGQVTVSTHMAGRGTDIVPDARALRAGGLHVVVCQHNPSARLDRQLAGRAGRQGQPGSTERFEVLDAPGAGGAGPSLAARVGGRVGGHGETRWPGWLLDALHAIEQRHAEALRARERARLLRDDLLVDQQLSFSPIR